MATTPSYWKQLSSLVGEDRRKAKRILLTYPIEVYGFGPSGQFFTERTTTLNVSADGCRFRLKAEVEPGAVVAIRLAGKNSLPLQNDALLYQVMWIEPVEQGREIGAYRLQPGNLWQVHFPDSQP